MSDTVSSDVRQGMELQKALTSWAGHVQPIAAQDARFQAAFEAIDRALIKTIGYMRDRKAGQPANQDLEGQLTVLWATASQAVSPIDAGLSNACMMKGLGWTDPGKWEAAKRQGLKIGVEDMESARMLLNAKRQALASTQAAPAWFPHAGAGFCAVTIIFLMYLLLGPPLEAGKKTTFDVLMAFCASASAGFLGGSAAAQGGIPFFDKSPITFSAVGGIGTFVVVFLVLHYAQ